MATMKPIRKRYQVWHGETTVVDCGTVKRPHAFACSGQMPGTGALLCVHCGAAKLSESLTPAERFARTGDVAALLEAL